MFPNHTFFRGPSGQIPPSDKPCRITPKVKVAQKRHVWHWSQTTITAFPARGIHRSTGDGHCTAGLVRGAIEEVCRKPGVVVYVINAELKEWLRATFIVKAGRASYISAIQRQPGAASSLSYCRNRLKQRNVVS
jgi:hypothetical protein